MPLLPLLETNHIKKKVCAVKKEDQEKKKHKKTSMQKVIKVAKTKKTPAMKGKKKDKRAAISFQGKKTMKWAAAKKGRKTQGEESNKAKKRNKTAMKGMKKTKVVAYARTSTRTNQDGNSAPRQLAACARVAQGVTMKKVSETISGMLPLNQRTKLQQLLSGEYDTVVVESARALSRSVETSEQIFNTAKENGVNIITSDLPDLFRVDGNPATNFMRRVMAAVTEFDRDVLVLRLQAGRTEARKKTTRRTQDGHPKVQGRETLLQQLNPTNKQMKQLRISFKKHKNGDFGWRPLRSQVAHILKLETQPAVETLRRMQDEIA